MQKRQKLQGKMVGRSLLDLLDDQEVWRLYADYRMKRKMPRYEQKDLMLFIENEAYRPIISSIRLGETFAPPSRSVINKNGSTKKRIVYSYDRPENLVLKLLTFLMLRKYDSLFADNLYSFRAGRDVKMAFCHLLRAGGDLSKKYVYKTDISNYFNSVDLERFEPVLKKALSDDPALFRFLMGLLENPDVMDQGQLMQEKKGIMAGVPTASFFANLYLAGLDQYFSKAGILYARYSDDVIVFADSEEEIAASRTYILDALQAAGLAVNPAKEFFAKPGDAWTFLGFSYQNGVIDICPASRDKLKAKLRRKVRALSRWQKKKGVSGEKAAKAFVRIINRKLYEVSPEHDLTWAKWFLPVINTTETLHELDLYMEDCIRFLATGTRTKARFDYRYEQIRELGFQPLLGYYYKEWPEEK